MIYRVSHRTQIRYGVPVMDARFNLRLQPVAWPGQAVSDYLLQIDPVPLRRSEQPGPYVLTTTQLEFDRGLSQLSFESGFRVEVIPPDIAGAGPAMAEVCRQATASRDLSARSPAPYLFPSRIAVESRRIGQWAAPDLAADTPVLDVVQALAARLHGEFTYKPGSTDAATAPVDAFAKRHGVCQDFAHVMIMGLRWMGVPAAYASGYLRTVPPPGQQKLVGADAMHAWVNVWCGDALGWIGVDPTNNCLARGNHIQIAMGRDYADVAPIDGTFVGAAPQAMTTAVDVVEVGTAQAGGDGAAQA